LFRILFWVDFDRGLTVQSEVAMDIYDAFEKEGIQIPFPQQDLHIKSFTPGLKEALLGEDKKDEKGFGSENRSEQ
jgi:small-conductance mechanosensitive channel